MRNEELDNLIAETFRFEPEYKLPADFASKLTKLVIKHEQWKTDLREYFYLTTVLFLLIILAFGFYYFIDKAFVNRIIEFISQNYIPVLLIGFITNFILFADRVLLRLLFNRQKQS